VRAGDVRPLEVTSRRVIALSTLEAADDPAGSVLIPRQPDGQERVERLHHDDEVAWSEIAFNEPGQRLPDARRFNTPADVILVQEDREETGVVVRGRALFILR